MTRHTLLVLLVLTARSLAFISPTSPLKMQAAPLWTTARNENDDDTVEGNNSNRNGKVSRVRKIVRRSLWSVIAAAGLTTSSIMIQPAQASAPVMAMPKAEDRDPATQAILEHERRVSAQTQKDLQINAAKARQIEAEQGSRARATFEKEIKDRQQRETEEKVEGLQQLKKDLLKQGICPFNDIEGQRQVIFYEKGVDMGEVAGTPFHLEKSLEQRNSKQCYAIQKQTHRKVIASMAQDLENREQDVVDYFFRHKDQTADILDMPALQAGALLQKYQANLAEYGQITVPAPGEKSAKEQMLKRKPSKEAQEKAKRLKAEQKQKEKEEWQRQKAEAKAAKAQAKADAKAAKQAAKAAKIAAAEEAKVVVEPAQTTPEMSPSEVEVVAEEPTQTVVASPQKKKSKLAPVAAAFVAVGGGGYAFKLYRDKAAEDEAERQRRYNLLMGGSEESSESTTPTMEDSGGQPGGKASSASASVAASTSEPAPTEPASKKRRLGMKMFGKKKNDRETDLNVLIAPEAQGSEFAAMLAKILTYGAPGRFPDVVRLPGGMPLETFDLQEAQTIISSLRESSNLSLEEAAEIFANVVNSMLIDIVDLASSSLKEKEDVTVKAINIVIDFLNHAASLYDSIANDVVIKPVTYGGDLSKSKLEEMYSRYTVKGMLSAMGTGGDEAPVSDDFDSRVALLQDVFEISEKKAEGLMMKAVQKSMMEMVKSGEGMEGMEQMLGGMGGLEGMAGLGGANGEGPSPEQLKEMLTSLKDMKDSGQIPAKDFEEVKKQFKKEFGSGLDEMVNGAGSDGELDQTEKELLELMKSIMED